MDERIQKYEGLIVSTTMRFRPYITRDLSDEDIKQELRIKVWKALVNFDPSYGFPEERHVFGAVRNRVKDLMIRKHRPEISIDEAFLPGGNTEVATKKHALSWMANKSVDGQQTHTWSSYSIDFYSTDILSELPDVEQQIAVGIVSGFTAKEIQSMIDVKPSVYARHVAAIKAYLDEHRTHREDKK